MTDKLANRYYDRKHGFKVHIVFVGEYGKVMVKPYKVVEDRKFVFKNTYRVLLDDLIRI